MVSKIILLIGVICAGITGYLVFTKVAEAEARMASISYLTFSRDAVDETLYAGEEITPSVLGRIELPNGQDVFGLGAQLIEDTAVNRSWIEGKELNTTIPRGRVLTYDLFERLETDRLDEIVRPGMRATTFAVSSATSLNNRVVPGNRIDVMGVIDGDGDERAELVLTDVRVMAVGTATTYEDYRGGQDRYSTITIEVTPDQAVHLATAAAIIKGSFMVLLRNPCDTDAPSDLCG